MTGSQSQHRQSQPGGPGRGPSGGHRAAMERILDAERQLGTFVQKSFQSLLDGLPRTGDSKEPSMDEMELQIQELVTRIKLVFRQGMESCILQEEPRIERDPGEEEHHVRNGEKEVPQPPHHLKAVDLQPLKDSFDWSQKQARAERKQELLVLSKTMQGRKSSTSAQVLWNHLPVHSSGVVKHSASGGLATLSGGQPAKNDSNGCETSQSTHSMGASSITLISSFSAVATSVETLSSRSGGVSHMVSQGNSSGTVSSGISTDAAGACNTSHTDDSGSGTDSRGLGGSTSDDEATGDNDNSDFVASDRKLEAVIPGMCPPCSQVSKRNVSKERVLDSSQDTGTNGSKGEELLPRSDDTGCYQGAVDSSDYGLQVGTSFNPPLVNSARGESCQPGQTVLQKAPLPSSMFLWDYGPLCSNIAHSSNATADWVNGWTTGISDLNLLHPHQAHQACASNLGDQHMAQPMIASLLTSKPRLEMGSHHADQVLNVSPGSGLPNIVATLEAQTRQLQQMIPDSATVDVNVPVNSDLMMMQQPHWDSLDPNMVQHVHMQSISFLQQHHTTPLKRHMPGETVPREIMHSHQLGGHALAGQHLGGQPHIGQTTPGLSFEETSRVNGSASIDSNSNMDVARLPERFQKLSLATRQRILLLIRHNSFVTIKDFDVKVVRKLSILTSTYGESECLVALDKLAVRLQSKQQGSMKNTAGYLDVAIGSYMEGLRAAAKAAALKAGGGSNTHLGAVNPQQVAQGHWSQMQQMPQPQHLMLNNVGVHRTMPSIESDPTYHGTYALLNNRVPVAMLSNGSSMQCAGLGFMCP